ncbi:unnamed protein product [Staurois parvus]|uniref:Uncharacterized protein n=1 Tax=Staurois parvus TaxID=386267 RepID=A0ABN9F5N3_9NEOB|nr:unnamed protein product [Staurois parvus]
MDLEGNFHAKIKKMAWGPPKIHTRPLYRACSLAGQERGGDKQAPTPPEPYQATCPQHGGVLWGRGAPPQSTLSPC